MTADTDSNPPPAPDSAPGSSWPAWLVLGALTAVAIPVALAIMGFGSMLFVWGWTVSCAGDESGSCAVSFLMLLPVGSALAGMVLLALAWSARIQRKRWQQWGGRAAAAAVLLLAPLLLYLYNSYG